MLQPLLEMYRQPSATRHQRRELLRRLAETASPESLAVLAEIVATDPPAAEQDALFALGPLFDPQRSYDPAPLFPRLFDALPHVTMAAIVLDLANFVTRRGLANSHPATERLPQLVTLFTRTVDNLKSLQQSAKSDPSKAATRDKLRNIFDHGFALFISLADALALIGDPAAIEPLRRGLELGHRRLRTEAASALARLGDAGGIDELVKMAAEPVVRTRAIAYLAELQLQDRAPEELRTTVALAEGELAAWLADSKQYGMPPQSLELLDAQRLSWPGFGEPVDCHLFRFTYLLPAGEFSGIGIAGPVTHTLLADLDDLPPSDVYALFAGWQAQHEEINETPADRFNRDERRFATEAVAIARSEGFSAVETIKLGSFFGQQVCVASAQRGGDAGTVIIADGECNWFRAGNPRRPIGSQEAYYIFKGRKLLRAFNPQVDD